MLSIKMSMAFIGEWEPCFGSVMIVCTLQESDTFKDLGMSDKFNLVVQVARQVQVWPF